MLLFIDLVYPDLDLSARSGQHEEHVAKEAADEREEFHSQPNLPDDISLCAHPCKRLGHEEFNGDFGDDEAVEAQSSEVSDLQHGAVAKFRALIAEADDEEVAVHDLGHHDQVSGRHRIVCL